MERKLAAILAADVVGYSRLMEQDEAGTFERLRAQRIELFEPEIEKHHGHVFKLMGDGLLAEFASVIDAMECAVLLQRELTKRNEGLAANRRVDVRMGVNLGEVIVEGKDRYGEGVNIAARLQQLAEPRNICVSGKVYDEVVGKLDLGFDFLGEQPVKSIVKPLRVYCVRIEGTPVAHATPKLRRRQAVIAAVLLMLIGASGAIAWYWARAQADQVLALPSGPSIAVLPFTNLSGDPGDVYFSVGLTEDIITALSRFSDLFVFARESTRRFESGSIDPQEVGRRLGARYVLVGSVRRSQDRLRITAKLLDAKDGDQLWSESYDRDLTAANVFAVQDEITERVVGLVGSPDAPLLKSKIQKELRAKRPESLAAYECVYLSLWVYDTFKEDDHARARDCLERAVDKTTPDYALAWAHLAQMYFEEYKYGWNSRPEPIERALTATKKALELDAQEQWAHYVEALILYVREKDLDLFYEAAERAIALNPNNAFILADLGLWMVYSGRFERGKALVEKSMILNPLHADWIHFALFLDYYRKGEYREALGVQLKMNVPNNQGIQTGLVAVYGQLGDTEKAKGTLAHILQLWPEFPENPRAWFVRRRFSAVVLESLMDGLRKAGLEVPPRQRQSLQ